MKSLLVTGYRAHELGIFNRKHKGIDLIKKAIASRLISLLDEGLEWVVTPGQYGVDLWACEAVLELKKSYPQMKLSVISAYEQPEENWKEDRQNEFRAILRQVDYYGVVSRQPYQGPWQLTARDDLMLRKTEGILLVYDEESGEASPKYMKRKAMKKHEEEGYGYYVITMEDLQSMAEEGDPQDH